MHDVRQFLCWQLSEDFKSQILTLTADGPISRDFKLRDQLRNASTSAPANIVEGFEYFRAADFARFLRYAVASLAEAQQRLGDALDSRYIDEKRFKELTHLASVAKRVTTNLMLSKERQAKRERAERRRPARRRFRKRS